MASLLIGLICYVVLELRLQLQPAGEQSSGDSVGAYVLLEPKKSPFLPAVDTTAVDMIQAETMMGRRPSKEEEDISNTN